MKQITFDADWRYYFDKTVPQYVKRQYLPNKRVKSAPFNKQDALFFSKGLQELSTLLTEERAKMRSKKIDYMKHSRFRSAYLLYFLQLQAAKFYSLFRFHERAVDSALKHANKKKVLKILDLGAGPGTASIALLLWLKQFAKNSAHYYDTVEFYLVDTNSRILQDGRQLILEFQKAFPQYKKKIKVSTIAGPWERLRDRNKVQDYSLILAGNVLNEVCSSPRNRHQSTQLLKKYLKDLAGGGVLLVEPAAKDVAQYLSQTRNELTKDSPRHLWGPCLHHQTCPMATGKDWCHLSAPIELDSQWMTFFSRSLGTGRKNWLKYSYLWFSSADYPAQPAPANHRRVLSEPIRVGGGSKVLLCEPNKTKHYPTKKKIHRGEIIKL